MFKFGMSIIYRSDQIFVLTYCMCAFPQGFLRPCQQVWSVHQVFVEPLTSDDWEILVGGPRDQCGILSLLRFSTIQVIAVVFELKHFLSLRCTDKNRFKPHQCFTLFVCVLPSGASQRNSGREAPGSNPSGFQRCCISCVGGQPHSHLHSNR